MHCWMLSEAETQTYTLLCGTRLGHSRWKLAASLGQEDAMLPKAHNRSLAPSIKFKVLYTF